MNSPHLVRVPCSSLRVSLCSQGVISFLHAALRRRKLVVQVHVRAPFLFTISDLRFTSRARIGGQSRKSSFANRKFPASVPQQQQGGFRKLVIVGASPTRGSILIYDLRVVPGLKVAYVNRHS
jgi:hypothetical protein